MKSDSVLTSKVHPLVWVGALVGDILHEMCIAGGMAEVPGGLYVGCDLLSPTVHI